MKEQVIVGQKFGQLTVTSKGTSRKGKTYQHCTCSCGQAFSDVHVPTDYLQRGIITACWSCQGRGEGKGAWETAWNKCSQKDYDTVGRTREYGWLTVLLYQGSMFLKFMLGDYTSKPHWLCRCKCGARVQATGAELRDGKKYSCTLCARQCKLERHHQRTSEYDREDTDAAFHEWRDEARKNMKEAERREVVRNKKEKHVEYTTRISAEKRITITTEGFWNMRGRHNKEAYDFRQVFPDWLVKGKGRLNFFKYLEESGVGLRPDRRYTLHRIDNDGDYVPGNIKWALGAEQNSNKGDSRIFILDKVRINQAALALKMGITSKEVSRRITRLMKGGFSLKKAAERIWADHQTPRNSPSKRAAQCA